MFFYFFVFLISILFYYAADKIEDNLLRYLFLACAIIVPAFVAGVRYEYLGMDMNTYVVRIWEYSTYEPSLDSLTSNIEGVEYLYLFFNFAVSRLTNNIHWFMFLHQFLLLVLLVASLQNNKDDGSDKTFSFLFYMLYLYNTTYSMYRQSIAIFIVLLAYSFLRKKKFIVFYSLVVVAYFFHSSAILAGLIPILDILIKKFENKMLFFHVSLVGFFVALYIAFRPLVSILVGKGVLSAKYLHYAEQFGYKTHKIEVLFIVLLLMILWMHRKFARSQFVYNQIFIYTLVSLYLILLGSLFEVATRVAYYFIFPVILLIPTLIKNKALNRQLLSFIFVALLFRYVYITYFTLYNFSQTIPYKSNLIAW